MSFVLQDIAAADFSVTGLEAEQYELTASSAKFDLTLFLAEAKGTLRGRIEYSSDLFDADRIARLAQHWLVLLKAVVATIHRRRTALRRDHWPFA